VDHTRGRRAAKRGGEAVRVELDEALAIAEARDIDLVALDEALERLEALDPRQASLVVQRFFGGLTIEEAAESLGISLATAKRDWATAKLWLRRELDGDRTVGA
jgi:RNA polymerase sigma factor (TIGR02999 family)